MPFHQATVLTSWCYLCIPLISQPRKVTICGRHAMAHCGTSRAMPCLLCYETSSTLLESRHCAFHVPRYGARVSRVYSPYFPYCLYGLQRYFLCCFWLMLLCNGQNIAKYEAHWLIGVPIINPRGARQPFFLAKQYAQISVETGSQLLTRIAIQVRPGYDPGW